ncbi:MAG: hypothetical protein ABW221_09300 [Vicinamibacteria bacterium]
MTALRRFRGPLGAAALCLAVLGLRAYENRGIVYDRFHLPAFDGHVYAAMAEEPRVFTVAPWGYRVLAPWLVHLSPWNAARGFGVLTPLCLFAAGLGVYACARRLGAGALPSGVAAAAVLASEPVAQILRYVLLAEPTTLALETLFLYALAAGASWPAVALVGVLGTASKEFFLLLLPAFFLARRRAGAARALVETAGVAAPAVVLSVVLRWWWAPSIVAPPGGVPSPGIVWDRLRLWALTQPAAAATLALLAALALAGALAGRGASGWRAAFAFVAAVAFAAPFLNPSDFSAPDLPRLHVYVLPALVPFALRPFGRLWPPAAEPGPSLVLPRGARVAAFACALLLAIAPFALVDRYRRLDLRADGDADRVLAFLRGTLVASTRLAAGEASDQTAVRASSDDAPGTRLRWFARDGWEPGEDAAIARGPLAVIVIPSRPPRALEVLLSLAPADPALRVSIGGRPLQVEWAAEGAYVAVPREALLRGDNALVLSRPPGGPPLELRRLRIVPQP